MKLHFITLTNKIEHCNVNNLRKSLYPYYLHVLNSYDPNIKNLSKLFKVFDFLNTCKSIADNDIICVVDAHDVLFNRRKHNINSLIKTFVGFDTDIVFSTENVCSHHSNDAKIFFESNSHVKNRYLNSGVILAYKRKYVEFLRAIISNIDAYKLPGSFSDQQVISRYLASVKPVVKLDYDNNLALTLNTATDVCFEDINACFVHVTFLAKSSQLQKYNNFLKSCS